VIRLLYMCVCVSWEGWGWEESALGHVMIFVGGIICSVGSSIASNIYNFGVN